MSYLQVKFYFKSRLNFLLLVFFLKWCILFMISYEFMKILSNVSYHIIQLKVRHQDVSRKNLLDEKQSGPLPLILLWNKYQLTGSKVYNTIFERMTTGKCQVGVSTHLICRMSQKRVFSGSTGTPYDPAHLSSSALVMTTFRAGVRSPRTRGDRTRAQPLCSTCQTCTGR